MLKPLLYSSCCILLLASCSDDGMDTGVDSVALCDCPELTAANVTYDPTGSGLSGATTQDAVDELAARPEGLSDAFGRITLEAITRTSSSTGTDYAITVGCMGTVPNTGLAMGGSCGANASPVSVQSSTLQTSGFTCIWNKPEGQAIEFTAKVSCLAPAVPQ